MDRQATKYELMTELRELNRGFPRIPISTMKKHELEAQIDVLKRYKADVGATMLMKGQAKPGPLGPRPIKMEAVKAEGEEDQDGENVIINAPVPPRPRQVAPPKKVVIQAPGEAPPKKKSPGRPPKVKSESDGPKDDGKTKSDRVSKCFCNCPHCNRK
jgi:hypothetical protein